MNHFFSNLSYFPENIYLVGGTVRDFFLKKNINDFDFVIDTSLEDFSSKVREFIWRNFKKYPFLIGKEFPPTMRVVLKNNLIIDITLLYENFFKDSIRRDFTINALYLDNHFNLIDPLSGYKDLKQKKIKVCSENSFKDDPVRMLRGIRFFGELNDFTLTKETFELIRKECYLIKNVAFERIKEELEKIFINEKRYILVKLLLKSGILFSIIPELKPLKNLEQRKVHKYCVLEHSLKLLKYIPEKLSNEDKITLCYVALLHDIGKIEDTKIHEKISSEIAKKILNRFKLSNKKKNLILKIILNHMRIAHISFNNVKINTLKKLVFEHYNIIDYIVEFIKMECKTKNLAEDEIHKIEEICRNLLILKKDFLAKKNEIESIINGKDIVDLGFSGEEIGKKLKKIRFLIFRDNISSKEEAEKLLKSIKQ